MFPHEYMEDPKPGVKGMKFFLVEFEDGSGKKIRARACTAKNVTKFEKKLKVIFLLFLFLNINQPPVHSYKIYIMYWKLNSLFVSFRWEKSTLLGEPN